MKKIHAVVLAIGLVVGNANATDFSFTGDLKDDDEVQEFQFTVAGPASDVTLRTWSYAGGTNAAGAEIVRGGFDPIVALFDGSTGNLIDQNDDGSEIADPVSSSSWDSLLIRNLSAGAYTATVTQFDSFANGPTLTDGFRGTVYTNFSFRDAHWALDILNVNSASIGDSYVSATTPPPIPEPESYALLLAGLGLVTFMGRRRMSEDTMASIGT